MTHWLRRHGPNLLTLIPVAGLVLIFWPARALRSDNFVFYLPNGSRVIALETIGQANYFPFLQVLNLVGKVQGLSGAQDSLKVWFGDFQIEVHADDTKVRVNRERINLSDPVRIENGQWMVPVNFLETVLPRVIHEPIVYRLGSRRAFIGDVRPGSFSFRLEPIANGSRLTLQFTDKVNIRTASSNGKWILFLGDRPVQPLEQRFNFQDPYLNNIQFDDQDGTPKLILTPTTDGLNFYPKLDETGKILQAEFVKPPMATPQQPPPTQVPENPGIIAPPTVAPVIPEPTAPAGGAGLPIVVLDAGHGAEDTGARGGNGLLEKDLVAQLVAHIRSTLLASKRYRVVLTRVGEVNPTFDQRAATANAVRPEVFFTFHAGNLGVRAPRINVYTLESPSPPAGVGDGQAQGLFIPWTTVQLAELGRSQQFAETLQKQLASIPGVEVAPPAAAPMRTLRSVNAPAVAVEIGSLAPDVDSSALTSTIFQDKIANAITQALNTFEGRRY